MATVENLQKFNLIEVLERSLDKERILAGIERMEFITEHPKFKVGEIIEFTGGFRNDIRFTSKITGFDKDGGIYVVWDCYWYPIKDDEIRQIHKVI